MKKIFTVLLCILTAAVFVAFLFIKEERKNPVDERKNVTTVAEQDAEKDEDTEKDKEQDKTAEKLLETSINYQIVYNMEITSAEMAAAAIREEGQRQRSGYDNPSVEKLELQMEEEFGIFAVNLGEISEETAYAIYEAFRYMYDRYPCLYGSLTNLTLGNMGNRTGGTVALTDRTFFIVNGEYGQYPFVEKYRIVLNARIFLNDEELTKVCASQGKHGYWSQGANVSSVIVHELGHQLQNVIVQKKYGLECPYYITEENGDAFCLYDMDRLKRTDNVTEEIMQEAYRRWQADYGNQGTYEDFAAGISLYALKDEKESAYSASETFAEALADIYLNGENASDGAKAIEEVIEEYLQ